MADRVGEQLGKYRLTRFLGQGGFAEVYLGEDQVNGDLVAIKVVHAQLTSNDLGRFNAEVQTVTRLDHPHIIHLRESGTERGTPFLVMDYAPGGTLRELHPRKTPLPLTTVLEYVQQVAAALQYAHDQKLIHRDIKPENMLLGAQGQVLLTDFGIALIAQSSHSQSLKEAAGTAAYMAPEQIQGKPRPASDQYALAVVVYEWLTGELPFQGSLTEMVAQHLAMTPPSLRGKVPTLPEAIEQVVLAALAKDPKARFPSVGAFAEALEQASQGKLSPLLFANTQVTPPTPLPPTLQVAPPGYPPAVAAAFSSAPTMLTPPQSPRSNGPITGGLAPTIPAGPGSASPFLVPPTHQPTPHRKRNLLLSVLAALVALLVIGMASAALYLSHQQAASGSNNSPFAQQATDTPPGHQRTQPPGNTPTGIQPTSGPTDTPIPGATPTDTPTPTNTPFPTSTTQPTATNIPVPPTPTNTPTPMPPTPTSTPQPGSLWTTVPDFSLTLVSTPTVCHYDFNQNEYACYLTVGAVANCSIHPNYTLNWSVTSTKSGVTFAVSSGTLNCNGTQYFWGYIPLPQCPQNTNFSLKFTGVDFTGQVTKTLPVTC